MSRFLLAAALILGGVAGWVGLLTTDGPEPVAQTVVQFFPMLFVLMPGGLAVTVWATLQTEAGGTSRMYAALVDARLMLLTAALVGAAGGCLCFWLIATALTGSVGGEDFNQVRNAILAAIPLWQVIVVIVVTLAAGLVLAQLAHQRSKTG